MTEPSLVADMVYCYEFTPLGSYADSSARSYQRQAGGHVSSGHSFGRKTGWVSL